jgi:Tfp pilus assembly protein PilE
MKKTKDYLIRNIVATLLCIPAFFMIGLMLRAVFFPYPNRFQLIMVLILIFLVLAGMIALSINYAQRVKRRHAEGDLNGTVKASNKGRKLYRNIRIILVGSWIVGVLLLVAVPGFVSYRERAHNFLAWSTMKSLVDAQERYHKKKNKFAKDPGSVIGWKCDHNVEVKIIDADSKCWSATARWKRSPKVFKYDHCGGGMQEETNK